MVLTVSEAAARLSVSAQRVRQLIADKRLHATRHGKRILMVDHDSVMSFVSVPAGRPKKIAK